MSPRTDDDFEAKRQQIIDGALHVFSSKGFEKATNKDIAGAAGIGSPGLIYHYFKDKADLFRQVLEERAPILHLLGHTEELMHLPPREALTRFGMAFLQIAESRSSMAMMKLMLGEATRRPAVAEVFTRIGPVRGLAFLGEYLERQMDAGTMRRMNPSIAARTFIGPYIVYILSSEIFVMPDARKISPVEMVETSVDIFLRGMEPPEEGRP